MKTKLLICSVILMTGLNSAFAGNGEVGSVGSSLMGSYKACEKKTRAFLVKRIKAERENFTVPFIAPICVATAEGKIDLDVTLAMLDKFATNRAAIDAGEDVNKGNLDKNTVLRLLNNSLIKGPSAERIAYEVSPLITSGKVDETCFVLNQQIRSVDEALSYCAR
ncbi:hypothetical protein [Bdellovibrio sp. HCB-110]|uniref:hypothetical protein n=1 Tax=Bdellovibrio sp. HCB-110 TaxID=3391182 RepID=UPI0039B473C3